MALQLVRALRGLRGVQLSAAGRTLDSAIRAEAILACYLEACASSDWRAHCITVADEYEIVTGARRPLLGTLTVRVSVGLSQDPAPLPPPPRYLLPCAFMRRYGLRFQQDHPATMRDQIQAKSVELSCDWCPKLNLAEFRRI